MIHMEVQGTLFNQSNIFFKKGKIGRLTFLFQNLTTLVTVIKTVL